MTVHTDPRRGRLLLVRHGESEGNRDRTFTQSAKVPLTPHGREQAAHTAAVLQRRFSPASIVASPFARARQTADIIAAALGLPVEIESALREQSFGIFAGRPYDALLEDAAYHEGPRWHWRPSGGESLVDVYERVVPVFERVTCAGAGQDIVIVSHGGVMLALCAYATGSWENLSVTPNAGVVVIHHENGRYGVPETIQRGDADMRAV